MIRYKWLAGILILIVNHSNGQYFLNAIVKDSLTSELLTGATIVNIENGNINAAVTDINGKARLEFKTDGEKSISISYLGYIVKSTKLELTHKENNIEILLSPDLNELGEITISSDRTNSRIEDVPTRIEVLGQDDMEEENGIKPGNIVSILGDIAGIQMQQVSASSGNTFARIQGLNGRYTQILKDGLPLFGGLSNSFGIMQIPPLDLKQIEIIKGSASTLYGGDAIGGIINLVTKEPSFDRELNFTLNQTSIGETDVNGYFSGRNNKFGFTFFAGQTFQRAYDEDKDRLSETPEISNTILHPKFVIYFSKKSTLTINYTGTFEKIAGGDMDYISDNSLVSLYHIKHKLNRQNADAKWGYDFSKNKNVLVKVSGSLLNQDLTTRPYIFNASQKIFYSEASFVSKSETMDWVTGINFNGDNFDNDTQNLDGVESYNYSTFGGFVQNTWRPFSKFIVESGFRGDYHSKYKFFPLFRLSLMYKFDEKFTLRLNGGLGYKIPTVVSYVDQETDLNRIALNQVLKAEESQGINADINYSHLVFEEMMLTINQSFFLTNLSGPVYDSVTPNTSEIILKNGASPLLTKGVQTYVRLQYHEAELYLSYVFTDIKKEYDIQNPRLAVTPQHNLSGTIFIPVKKWRFGIEGSFIGGQLNEDYKPVKNYTLVAGMIQYNPGKVTLVLNCENLLNFRQSKHEKIYDGPVSDPVYHKLWGPIEGRVINLSIKIDL